MQSRASSCLLSEAAPFYLGRFPQFSTWNDSEGDSGHVRCFQVSSLACQSTYTPSASEILTLSSSDTDKTVRLIIGCSYTANPNNFSTAAGVYITGLIM